MTFARMINSWRYFILFISNIIADRYSIHYYSLLRDLWALNERSILDSAFITGIIHLSPFLTWNDVCH